MKNIFIVYGHYNQNSFNAAIKNTFTEAAQKKGHTVDCVDLYKEKFNPVYAGEKPDEVVLDHQKRIDKSDVIVLVAPIWNYRMPAIVEGWIDTEFFHRLGHLLLKSYLEIMVTQKEI